LTGLSLRQAGFASLPLEDALFDHRPTERDGRANGRHVVSRVIELVTRWVIMREKQFCNAEGHRNLF
jgi:hypothetical protein